MSNKKLIVGAIVGLGVTAVTGATVLLKKLHHPKPIELPLGEEDDEKVVPEWLIGEWSVKSDTPEVLYQIDDCSIRDINTGVQYFFDIEKVNSDNESVILKSVFKPNDHYVFGRLVGDNQAYMANDEDPLDMKVLLKKA